MKKIVWLWVFIAVLMMVLGASAATLTLPASLIMIEEEAFAGNSALDQVILGNKTQVIGPRAFADSSVKQVTMSESVRFIAETAFEGVNGLKVNAAEGTYAYAWAVQHEYIKIPEIPAGAATKVIMPEKLQAGANLTVQVFGPANTVSHTIFLINNTTKKGESRLIEEQNGIAYWEGFDLENGTYTVKVYTVTDNYSGSTPVSKNLVISGKRPAGPEDIELPEKIGREDYEINTKEYEKLIMEIAFFDKNGDILDDFVVSSEWDSLWLWTQDEAASVHVSFRSYNNGLWSEWSKEKSIKTVYAYLNRPGLKNLSVPDTVKAGQDIEISFELENGINYLYVEFFDENGNGQTLYAGSSNTKLIIPGYKTEPGTYMVNFRGRAVIEDELMNYTIIEKTITVLEGKKPANVVLTANKALAYTNENVELTISSNGTEGAYIKIVGDYTNYKGCNLQNDGSGICYTNLSVLNNASQSRNVTLSACVFLDDRWSEWSEPITVNVSRPEPLPVPVIDAKESYDTGEDIIVAVSGVDDADYYDISLREYFSDEQVLWYQFNKGQYASHRFGEDAVFSGVVFGNGTYKINVDAHSSIRGSSRVSKVIKVSGTRATAPEVTFDPSEFRINQETTFTIDTTDCEEAYVKYKGYGDFSWGDSYSITPTGKSTKWTYQFSNETENANFTFSFATKKNGRWSYSKEIKKTVLGLPKLNPAVIHVDDSIEAGKDFNIMIDPVENATRYEYDIYQSDRYIRSNSSNSAFGELRISGYELDPGDYKITVRAYSDDYATSVSEKTFTITGTKTIAPLVSVDKTEFYEDESMPVITVTANGAEAVRCSNGSVSIVNEEGFATFSPYMYAYDGKNREYQFRFCAVKNEVWSAWSDPVTVTIKPSVKPALVPLDKADIHLPTTFAAGTDFTFSFDAVNDATSYRAYISYYYVDSNIYSKSDAAPGTDLTVSGRILAPGTYVAKVYAYADGRESSYSSIKFKVTGERGAVPTVTSDKTECAGGETVTFGIDTENADEVYISYRTSGNYSGNSNSWTITPQASNTEWTYTVPSYYNGTTYTFSFNVKRDGIWSKTKAVTVTVP